MGQNFNQVKRTGSADADATDPRVAHRQAVADFFFVNSVVVMERALVGHLRTAPCVSSARPACLRS